MEFLRKYYIHFLVGLGIVGLLYLLLYIFTPEPQQSELDKYKIEQLNKQIDKILENQKKLDLQIQEYKKEISKIDSTIADVQNQKVIVKEYYKDLGEEIKKMKRNEIDSFFYKRYKF